MGQRLATTKVGHWLRWNASVAMADSVIILYAILGS